MGVVWAIAWIAHKDYSTAGFKLLPAEKGPTKFTALQTIIYALLLVPVCVLPYIINLTSYNSIKGIICFALVMLANVFLVGQCIRLYKEMDVKAARRVMFSSYIYLPVILLALLASKM
jgi:protoheme IX farnesyltransferase